MLAFCVILSVLSIILISNLGLSIIECCITIIVVLLFIKNHISGSDLLMRYIQGLKFIFCPGQGMFTIQQVLIGSGHSAAHMWMFGVFTCGIWMDFLGKGIEAWTLTHWGRDKMADISQTTFSNAFSWMKMFEFLLEFHWSLFLGVQLTIFQHWFK